MTTQEVRFNRFEETRDVEVLNIWDELLTNRQTFYDMLIAYEDTHSELEASSEAQAIIDIAGYTFPSQPTGE